MTTDQQSGEAGTTAGRAYRARWAAGTFKTDADDVDDVKVVGLEYFSDDLGYDEDERADLAALALGETWEAPHYGESHTITRIS